MEENKKSVDESIEKLAIITDAFQELFPEGKIICVLELEKEEFKKIQNNFRKIDLFHNKFSIDISGVDFVFINKSETNNLEEFEENKKEEKIKKSFFEKLFSFFKSGRNSV